MNSRLHHFTSVKRVKSLGQRKYWSDRGSDPPSRPHQAAAAAVESHRRPSARRLEAVGGKDDVVSRYSAVLTVTQPLLNRYSTVTRPLLDRYTRNS